jgi:hypothetical protein
MLLYPLPPPNKVTFALKKRQKQKQ